MISAGTGDTTGKDLRAVRSELPKAGGVLVIDLFDFVDAERAKLEMYKEKREGVISAIAKLG